MFGIEVCIALRDRVVDGVGTAGTGTEGRAVGDVSHYVLAELVLVARIAGDGLIGGIRTGAQTINHEMRIADTEGQFVLFAEVEALIGEYAIVADVRGRRIGGKERNEGEITGVLRRA